MGLILKADDVIQMIQTISDKNIESDDDDADDGESEVRALARRSLELLGERPKQGHSDRQGPSDKQGQSEKQVHSDGSGIVEG